MKKNKAIGIALIVLALLVVTGLVIEKAKYWFPLDCVTIAVCAVSGILLIREK
ncbi:MAG: hypothetical protein WCY34_04865 [Candidatus Omnitrophota bacterium]|jgi:uncharacterized membrane-anchored protein